jgi:hypothetical protein
MELRTQQATLRRGLLGALMLLTAATVVISAACGGDGESAQDRPAEFGETETATEPEPVTRAADNEIQVWWDDHTSYYPDRVCWASGNAINAHGRFYAAWGAGYYYFRWRNVRVAQSTHVWGPRTPSTGSVYLGRGDPRAVYSWHVHDDSANTFDVNGTVYGHVYKWEYRADLNQWAWVRKGSESRGCGL